VNEQATSVLLWLVILLPLGVFARQMQRVRRGTLRRTKATLVFFSYSILPVLLYALAFLVLVGVEELTGLSAITEGMARTLPFVAAIGLAEVLLLTVIFAIASWFLRAPADAA